jgi:hypothetical protein
VELAAVDHAGDHLVHVVGRANVVGDDRARVLRASYFGAARLLDAQRPWLVRGAQVADDVAHDGQRVLVVLGEVVGHARFFGVQVAAAQVLGADLLAVAALTSGGPARKIVPCSFTITLSSLMPGHRRRRGAGAHHAGDLRDAMALMFAWLKKIGRSGRGRGRPRPGAAGWRRRCRPGRCTAGGCSAISCARKCFLTVSG